MTITQTAAETEHGSPPSAQQPSGPGVVAGALSADHKVIGKGYIAGSLLFLLLGLVLGLVVGIERLDPESMDVFADVDSFFQAFVLHRVGLVVLGVVPLLLGLGLVVTPLQVGAPSAAFPRAAAASFWGWLIGAVIMVVGFATDGGLGAPGGSVDRDATALTLLALGLVVLSLMLGTISLLTTVIALRPAGMALGDVPFFAWSCVVGGSIWMLTLPVLFADVVKAYVDVAGRPPILFGVPETMTSEFLWATRQPQIYAFVIPVLGIVADVVATSAKVRQKNRGTVLAAIGAFGILSFGAYAQSIGDGISAPINAVYVAMGVAAVLPVLALLGGMADTLRRGAANVGLPSAPLIGAILTLLLLLGATIIGALRVIDPLELIGTSADGGHFAAVLLTGLVGGTVGLQHWGVKLTGRPWGQGLGRLSVLVLTLGVLLTAVPDVVSGFLDQPDFPVGAVEDGVEALNVVAVIGGAVLLLGLLLLVAVGAASLTSRVAAPADPWGGQTLEWASPSPPPVGNFVEPLPVVTSPTPLLDAALTEGEA
ncbi:MAG: cbb3-type cytochrome c oxidase subunit I [Acidimicrobiales bacterium]|jgi:heme/copper-type cytochrome/quinol oxidase subunit 1|nr:cbb3-type cytochrome c oxidase subunit I [Acidimicrobiales bacterium]